VFKIHQFISKKLICFSYFHFQLILNGEKLPDPNKTKTPKLKKKKVAKPEFDELSKDSLFIDDQTFSKVITTSASRKKRDKGEKGLTVEQLNTRRKRLWMGIIRKEIGKAHKSRNFNIREKMTNGKRVATQCMRAVRQKAMISQRVAKETVWRAKRLTREMQVMAVRRKYLPSF
jgi:DNA helicase INO80